MKTSVPLFLIEEILVIHVYVYIIHFTCLKTKKQVEMKAERLFSVDFYDNTILTNHNLLFPFPTDPRNTEKDNCFIQVVCATSDLFCGCLTN